MEEQLGRGTVHTKLTMGHRNILAISFYIFFNFKICVSK